MTKLINLKNRRFGKLKVIKRANDKVAPSGSHRSAWLCKCDCGNTIEVQSSNLQNNHTQSCGCYNKERVSEEHLIDLTNQKFGRLIVIERTDDKFLPSGYHKTQWLCRCNCGNNKIVSSENLRNGHTTSCGCYQKQRASEARLIDLTNKKFGKLKVIKRIKNYTLPSGGSLTRWLCKCDCGNTAEVTAVNLQEGYTKSCGCLNESWITSKLKEYYKKEYNGISEHKVFKNPDTNHWLSFDIYLPSKNVFIEVHGNQHYNLMPYFHESEAKRKNITIKEEFQYRKKLDRMKRKYARQHGLYIEIDLRKIKTTKDAICLIERKIKDI